MATETGFITELSSGPTKFGERFYVHVNGHRLMAGKFKPNLAVGDFVQFETEQNGQYTNLAKGSSFQKVEAPAGVAAPTPPKATTIGIDRQDVISRQAALNSALQFVQILTANDAIPLPKTKAKDADMLMSIVLKYTADLYHLNTMTEYEIPDEVVAGGADATPWDEQE